MSLDATRWAWMQRITATRKLVLLSLADRADEKSVAYPSVARMAKDTCLDRKTIMGAITDLEESGLIKVIRKNGFGSCYQLIGVQHREEDKQYQKRDQYQDRDRYQKRDTPSPKNGTATSTKNGTENLPIEPINESIGDTKKKTSLNDDSVLPPAWKEKGKAYGMTEATIENEFGKFKNHHLEKKTRSESWIRQWDTWCRGWVTYGAKQVQSRTINLAPQQTSYWN